MKCRERFIKMCGAFIFGIAALGFALSGMDDAVTHSEMSQNSLSCFPSHAPAPPSALPVISEIAQTNSRPLAYLFQILFILFIISPPIIALMLFLIWKELKARNRMK